jgi:hypothetical protein
MPMLPPREHVAGRDGFSSGSGKMTALVLIGAAAYLYLNLFYSLSVPFLLGGDQVSFWIRALRILDHQLVYRDFYQFTPPGIDLLYGGLFRTFGPQVWVTNLFVLLLGVALCWMCLSIASRVMSRRSAMLATALFLVLIYCKLLNGTHHWISLLCVMGAVRLRMRSSAPGSTFAIGTLLGVASFFTQTRGVAVLLAFVLFLAWRKLRFERSRAELLKSYGLLLSGFAAAWFLLDAYFIATVGLSRMWYFQVTYVRRYVGHGVRSTAFGLPSPLTWHNLPKLAPYLLVYSLLPVVYLATLWRGRRRRDVPLLQWEQVMLLAIVGFLLMIEVGFNPNWLRIYAISMPAFILLGWNVARISNIPRYAVPLLWAGLACVAVWQTAPRRVHQSHVIALPAGTVATTADAYAKLLWFSERTKPGDYFFQAAWPGMYLPLGLRNPSYLENIVPFDGPPPREARRVPEELEARRVPFVLWSPSLDADALQLPASDNYLSLLHAYLVRCYAPVQPFEDGDEVWQRRDPGACTTKKNLALDNGSPGS